MKFTTIAPSEFAKKDWLTADSLMMHGRAQKFHVGQYCSVFFKVADMGRQPVSYDVPEYGRLLNDVKSLTEALTQIVQLEDNRSHLLLTALKNVLKADNGSDISLSAISISCQDGERKGTTARTDGTYIHQESATSPPVMILNVEIKSEMGPSETEPTVQNLAYFMRYGADVSRRQPALLLTVAGCVAILSGAVWMDGRAVAQPLCVEVFGCSSMQARLLGFVNALKYGVRELRERAKKPQLLQTNQPDFCALPDGRKLVYSMTGPERNRPYLFRAQLDSTPVIVKFCRTQYGTDAHKALADEGFAPMLHCAHDIGDGWWVVVMDEVINAVPWSAGHKNNDELRSALRRAVELLGGLQCVHGDLRAPNVLVVDNKVYIIDFDWSATRRYPPNRNHVDVRWPPGSVPGGPIERQHDVDMLDKLLERK